MAVSKYELLIRLASEKTDAMAKQMAFARENLTRAQSKLEQLANFLGEYKEKRIERGSMGISVTQWVDFQHFIDRLDVAVNLQKEEVTTCQSFYDVATAQWRDARKRLKAMETLKEAESRREDLKRARQEQKQTDELASRVLSRGE